MQPVSVMVFIVGGLAFFLFLCAVITWKAFFKKAGADVAFVRTGMGGASVVVDGGGFVVPIVHEMSWVTLEAIRVPVEFVSDHGVITADNHRADLSVEFVLRVPPRQEAVLAAARVLGLGAESPEAVKQAVAGRLTAALREAAQSKTLALLYRDRDGLTHDLENLLEKDLESMGLDLDGVNVLHLDLTEGKIEEVLRTLDSEAGSAGPKGSGSPRGLR